MVSIIVINFNGLKNDFLPKCLSSLTKQTYKSLEIIVVDNASSDDSVQYIVQNFPNIILIRNQENVGFCQGNNIGYEKVNGKYVLFANNDTVFQEDSIEKLVFAIELDNQIGMVSPKLVRPSSNDQDFQILDSTGLLLLDNLMLRDRGFGEMDTGQYDEAVFLFAPCGASGFFRRDVLETIKNKCGELWDEDFIAYYEDGDLAWRIHQEGWKCLYFPEAIVIHHRGGSSSSNFFDKPISFKVHTIKNRYLMLIKNVSKNIVLNQWTILIRQEILIWGYLILRPRLLFTVLQTLLKKIPIAIKKRKLIKPKTGKESLIVFEIEPLENFS